MASGHTGADEQQIRDAIQAGATMSTHLGNGAHASIPRHANYITYQMAADELAASFIVDGIHLPPSFVKVAIRAKRPERSILTTDAVAPAGCAPGMYRLGHLEVELLENHRVELPTSHRLAGSALSMDRGVENVMRFAGVSLYEALRMATVHPAQAIGLAGRQGFLEPGEVADLVYLQFNPEEQHIPIEKTVCAS